MTKEIDNYFPRYVSLDFLYSDEIVYSIPIFLLVMLARESDGNTELLEDLEFQDDLIANEDNHLRRPNEYIKYLQDSIRWETLYPYIQPGNSHTQDLLERMWRPTREENRFIDIRFNVKTPPEKLYRYMPFIENRLTDLIVEKNLFLPCPALFNDPFDSSLDEEIRLTFIESAMGCFSVENDNILLYSHYANNHKGICVGFDTQKLIQSLTKENNSLKADLRPVWYFSKMPPFKLPTQPALCATSKHDVWSYEKEYRLFMVGENASLAPSKSFNYDPNAITELICGCKASDETIKVCKTLTQGLASCERKVAQRKPNQFGVSIYTIPK